MFTNINFSGERIHSIPHILKGTSDLSSRIDALARSRASLNLGQWILHYSEPL